MSQVEFEEENALDVGRSFDSEQEEGGLIGTIMKTGIAKTKTQANVIMVIIILICVGLMAFFLTR